ncbi:MAG: cytochrome c oxidase subunit 4 [Actinomycetota bacterium]|nr:cytochrome c oxidase subunit 4 [Actinomycetota bacterium]MDP2289052.1 cytochrome c oxidase subunit 4 [Actinomycetota bacterium]
MKIEGLLFAVGCVFFLLIAAIYWFVSNDPIGTTALVLCGGLAFLVGFYLLYTAKRVYPRPEDRGDANIDEADPEYGFFSPNSWWPLVVGFAAFCTVLGLVFAVWLIAFGAFLLVIALIGWLFEYYRRDFAH